MLKMEVFEWLTVNCIGLCITPGIQKRGTEWGGLYFGECQ